MPKPTDKAKVTWLLPRALYEEARSAALVTSEAGGSPTLSALFEEALQEKLKKLRRRYNRGRPFRRRKANLLAGRPPSRR